ncbi:MAG: tetratricopeptide repeat protein [Spirochaetes bacterium]|nr:tetratricopeptide repeat protein [Spirochaetota bacterium]
MKIENILSNQKIKKAAVYTLLAVIFILNLFIKFNFISKMQTIDLKDEFGFFSTEMAFHFRHFKMVADGNKIPKIDHDIQYPEGLDIVKYETPFMDKVLGTIYRTFFPNVKQYLFVVYFSIFFYSLIVLLVFFGVKVLFDSDIAGLISAAFYALTPAAIMRNISGFYSREDIALPFIFLSFIFYIACIKKDNIIYALIASVSLFISLATWHFTQLYLNVFATGIIVIYYTLKINKQDIPYKNFFILFATVIFSSLLLPILRTILFVFSPAVMILLGITVNELLFPINKNKKINLSINIVVLIVCLAGSIFLQRLSGAQTHAFGLLFYKLLTFNQLPENPSMIPFEIRVMWAGNSMGDDFTTVMINFLSVLIIFPIALIILAIDYKKSKNSLNIILIYFSFVYFILYILINRMSVFAVFFIALALGAFALVKTDKVKMISSVALISVLVIHMIFLFTFKYDPLLQDQRVTAEMYNFIKDKTDKDAVILSNFETGPGIALYTDRKVNLHSKFESKMIREKVSEYYKTLYSTSENDFYEFCLKNKTSYYVYSTYMALNTEKGGHLYYGDALPLDSQSNVFKFHFKPGSFKHFKLVYQSDMYRIYFVSEKDVINNDKEIKIYSYEPIYNLNNYSTNPDVQLLTKEDLNAGFNKAYDANNLANTANKAYMEGIYEKALINFIRFFQNSNFYDEIIVKNYIETFLKLNKISELNEFLVFATASFDKINYNELPINNVNYWHVLGNIYYYRKDFASAEKVLKKALTFSPNSEDINLVYGFSLQNLNKIDNALEIYRKVLRINPDNLYALNNIVYIYYKTNTGSKKEALSCAERSLKLKPDQPDILQIKNNLE